MRTNTASLVHCTICQAEHTYSPVYVPFLAFIFGGLDRVSTWPAGLIDDTSRAFSLSLQETQNPNSSFSVLTETAATWLNAAQFNDPDRFATLQQRWSDARGQNLVVTTLRTWFRKSCMGHSRECKVELTYSNFRKDSMIFTTTLLPPRLGAAYQETCELGRRRSPL